MPKANAKFPFEFKIIEGLGKLGVELFGELSGNSGFIIQLDNQGQIIQAISASQNPDFLSLDSNFDSYLLLDVIDQGEYIYAKWENVSYDNLLKHLKLSLTSSDFIDRRSNQTGELKASGSIMF